MGKRHTARHERSEALASGALKCTRIVSSGRTRPHPLPGRVDSALVKPLADHRDAPCESGSCALQTALARVRSGQGLAKTSQKARWNPKICSSPWIPARSGREASRVFRADIGRKGNMEKSRTLWATSMLTGLLRFQSIESGPIISFSFEACGSKAQLRHEFRVSPAQMEVA